MKKLRNLGVAAMLAAAPGMALADFQFSGEGTLGYGDLRGTGRTDGFAHLDLRAVYDYEIGSGITFGFDINADGTYNPTGNEDFDFRLDTRDGATVYVDFGAGGRLSYSTASRCGPGRAPFIDGDIIDDRTNPTGGGDSVHPGIASKFRCVGATPPVRDVSIQPRPFEARTQGYFLYENTINKLDVWAAYDPTQELYGTNPYSGKYDKDDSLTGMAEWEVGARYDFGLFTASLAYTDLDNIDARVRIPMRKIGLTAVLRYEELLNASGNNYRGQAILLWRPKNLGVFKGIRAHYQFDDSPQKHGHVLQLNFGAKKWFASIAADQDGDFALEGAYKLNDKSSVRFGYDAGCDAGECFDANNGFLNAPTQSASWVIGYSRKF